MIGILFGMLEAAWARCFSWLDKDDKDNARSTFLLIFLLSFFKPLMYFCMMFWLFSWQYLFSAVRRIWNFPLKIALWPALLDLFIFAIYTSRAIYLKYLWHA